MTSERARIGALSTLTQSATAGGYTLPTDVVDAHAVWQRLRQVELPTPRQLHIEDAAGRIVHTVTRGEALDLLEVVLSSTGSNASAGPTTKPSPCSGWPSNRPATPR